MIKITQRRNLEKSVGRIESFSDSVFGFAITLLVLELLQIPQPEMQQNLLQILETHWYHILAFFIGFFTILVCWINHHHLFCFIIQYDGRFLLINGLLLLVITFTPIPTSNFSEFLLNENGTGLTQFGLTYFLIALVSYTMWVYAYHKHLLAHEVDEGYYKSIIGIFRLGLLYTFVALILCFFSSGIAMVMYLLLFTVFAFPHHFTLLYQNYVFERGQKNEE